MKGAIETAKAEFLQAKGALVHALDTTPDDRLDWSPSPTARNPLHLVAHAAWSIGSIHRTLTGDTFAIPTTAGADAFFLEWERDVRTRDEALRRLEESAAAFEAFLDGLLPGDLDTLAEMPFGMGKYPWSVGITFPAKHTLWHVAQLEYLQTIYGDRDWHTPYGR